MVWLPLTFFQTAPRLVVIERHRFQKRYRKSDDDHLRRKITIHWIIILSSRNNYFIGFYKVDCLICDISYTLKTITLILDFFKNLSRYLGTTIIITKLGESFKFITVNWHHLTQIFISVCGKILNIDILEELWYFPNKRTQSK